MSMNEVNKKILIYEKRTTRAVITVQILDS